MLSPKETLSPFEKEIIENIPYICDIGDYICDIGDKEAAQEYIIEILRSLTEKYRRDLEKQLNKLSCGSQDSDFSDGWGLAMKECREIFNEILK